MGSTPAGGRLLDVLIQKGNKSGSIKPGPHALRDLKKSIEGVPFKLLQPGMSGVGKVGDMLGALQSLIKMPGMSMSSLGFQPIIGKLTQALKDPVAGASQLSPADFEKVLGSAGSLSVALLSYGGALSTVEGVANSEPSSTP